MSVSSNLNNIRRLRRSEIGSGPQHFNTTNNDDEAERREARRRTMQCHSEDGDSIVERLEDNESLKKWLDIYQGNKLSRENAWSFSLIDTLSKLLNRHHKILKNFQVASCSLEASSKVYSLRVDSVHTNVLRMMAGLNAQTYNEKQQENANENENDLDDNNNDINIGATEGTTSNNPIEKAAVPEKSAPPKKSKSKRLKCFITKNKETINARLDKFPLQDPVFGKLNSTVGSINSSNRLMNNVLKTKHSVLKLRTTFQYWNSVSLSQRNYSAEFTFNAYENFEYASSDRLVKVINHLDNLELRPLHSGYKITNTPAPTNDNKRQSENIEFNKDVETNVVNGNVTDFPNIHEMSMAFDMNAECEPLQISCQVAPILDVNYAELDDLTAEDRTAINNCRALRRAPIIVEDLRPIESTCNLEYSYRPMDKISQFWAGPSHWKFKRTHIRPKSLMAEQQSGDVPSTVTHIANQKSKRVRQSMKKKEPKKLNFLEYHDDRFVNLGKFKIRKVNIQNKWDQKKLKLPVDLKLSSDIFQYFTLAPGLLLYQSPATSNGSLQIRNASGNTNLHNRLPYDDSEFLQQAHFTDNNNNGSDGNILEDINMANDRTSMMDRICDVDDHQIDNDMADGTVLEIPSHFEGAPTEVTKIIVPFAKRAKVIDMKNLKRTCSILLNKQLKNPVENAESIPEHPTCKNEEFIDGFATFSEIYNNLPGLLTQGNAESVSPSIAFYSLLHLANEHNLRLIPKGNLEDCIIRKLTD